MLTVSAYVIKVMKGAMLELIPTTQPPLALLCPHRVERRHWLSRVQHCAAICGWRIRVLTPGTSVTERTLSIPGLRQKVIVPSRPPSITCTPAAGMLVSVDPGGGGAAAAGDGGDGACNGGDGGGNASQVRTSPAEQTFSPAAGLRHSLFWLVSVLADPLLPIVT